MVKSNKMWRKSYEPSEKSDDECGSNLGEPDAVELKEDITLIQKHEDIVKNTKHFEQLFEVVVLIESTLYFKINLYKFISKYPVLERLTLSSHYSQNNFRLINSVCKEDTDLFQMWIQVMLLLITAIFNFFLCCREKCFYNCENFFTAVRTFLLPWEFFSCCENLTTIVRIFLLLGNFFTAVKVFPWCVKNCSCCDNFLPVLRIICVLWEFFALGKNIFLFVRIFCLLWELLLLMWTFFSPK